jgi:hypothetical protein
MTRQADDTDIMAEVLATKLGSNTALKVHGDQEICMQTFVNMH